jgi:peptide deformylase
MVNSMKIVQEGEHTALRDIAKKVPKELFGTPELTAMIEGMFAVLGKEHDGVALAAPQVGISYQIFVVSPKILPKKNDKHLVYINPKLSKLSQEKKYMEEGCLSVRWLYGQVLRHTKATIVALDENGIKFERGASGLLAHIFQHETDHLSGTLFIDKAVGVTMLEEDQINYLESKNERN